MKITIEANSKEIADLVSQLQNQPKGNLELFIDADKIASSLSQNIKDTISRI